MATVGRLLGAEIPRLNRYARALMRNRDGAEDLVQDTILRALENAHLWQPGTNLRAWLFTLMHNQYVNSVRRLVRQPRCVELNHRSAATPPNQLEPLILRDLDCALLRLPRDQRAALQLVGIDGMKYDEAAAVCGIPVGTLRSRLSRARDAVHAMIEGEGACRRRPAPCAGSD